MEVQTNLHNSKISKPEATYLGRWKIGLAIVVVSLFLLGVVVRLVDLTDPPLDFHGTRQLRNAIVARGIYSQIATGIDPEDRQAAIAASNRVGVYEPPILEAIVAGTVKLVGTDKNKIIHESELLLNDSTHYSSFANISNPFGDGNACKRIVNRLAQDISD